MGRSAGRGRKKLPGAAQSFRKIPNGVPGVETRLPLLFSEGVGKGRISLQQFVALSATNAAKIYGLHPRKGTIAVGADADIVIFRDTETLTVAPQQVLHRHKVTPYAGRTLHGVVDSTYVRGRRVWHRGELLEKPTGRTFARETR